MKSLGNPTNTKDLPWTNNSSKHMQLPVWRVRQRWLNSILLCHALVLTPPELQFCHLGMRGLLIFFPGWRVEGTKYDRRCQTLCNTPRQKCLPSKRQKNILFKASWGSFLFQKKWSWGTSRVMYSCLAGKNHLAVGSASCWLYLHVSDWTKECGDNTASQTQHYICHLPIIQGKWQGLVHSDFSHLIGGEIVYKKECWLLVWLQQMNKMTVACTRSFGCPWLNPKKEWIFQLITNLRKAKDSRKRTLPLVSSLQIASMYHQVLDRWL